MQIGSSLCDIKLMLVKGEIGCSFECRSLLLGALIKFMHDYGFFEDGISTASETRSLEATIRLVREMKSPSKNWHPRMPSSPSCKLSLSNLTEPCLDKALKSMSGLSLSD